MNQILKKLNFVIQTLLIVFMAYQLLFFHGEMTLSKVLTTLCILPLTYLPNILERYIKVKEELKLTYYLFIIAALVFGSILSFYYKISWYDLFTHFLSGIFTCVIALLFLDNKNLIKKENVFFCIVFMLSFSLAVASLWEFFEFFSDKILKGDVQWVQETGVDDTMTDMLIAFFGSILYSIYFKLKTR